MRRVVAILLSLVMMFSFIVFIVEIAPIVKSSKTIYVDDEPGVGPGNPPENYTTIQAAIDAANPGDTVFVYNGTYFENVRVNKTINLTGENWENTIIDGGVGVDVVRIDRNWVNVSGFTVTNGQTGIDMSNVWYSRIFNNNISKIDGKGIWLSESIGNKIYNNIISNNSKGIRFSSILFGCSGNNITGNNISSNDYGISFSGSTGNNITDNIVNSNTDYGISISGSNSNNIINNNVSFNGRGGIDQYGSVENNLKDNTMINNGIWIQGNKIEHWNTHNIDTSNTVNGKPVQYWKDRTAGKVPAVAGQVILANCTNVRVEGQELTHGTVGIALGFSSNNSITSNDVSSNILFGIYLLISNGNNIKGNNASLNFGAGIHLSHSNKNRIIGNMAFSGLQGIRLQNSNENQIISNTFSSNSWVGIFLESPSLNNTIYHNNLIDNIFQAVDETNNGNYWDNGYPSGGNFWSDFDEPGEGAFDDFNGPDQNIPGSDGIVDLGPPAGGKNPYVIDSDSQDNYPLINPMDNSPPIITNLQPPDGSTTNDNTPTISADYSDLSGIDVSSVILKVDGIDVIFFATVTTSGVSYVPITAIPDGVHTVYLEVKDIYGNLATATWSFTVDATSPNVDAGIDATVNSTYLQDATVTDPVPSSGIASYLWTQESGPGTVTFGTPDVEDTNVGVDTDGQYDCRLTVTDNAGNTAFDEFTLVWDATPPTVDAGSDAFVNSTYLQDATVTDPAPSSGIASYLWTQESGPGVVIFGMPNAEDTNVGADTDGQYVCRLTVTDNAGNTAFDEFTLVWDTTPPTITNLRPPNASSTNNNTPMIGADYSDSLGINISSVVLIVDGMDVTPSATVTAGNVGYIPGTALSDDIHTVYLEVKDIYGNLATVTWSFTVDTLPPIITNLQPPDLSTTNNSTPTLSADYSDLSGINVSSVMLEVDSVNVTLSATVMAISVRYIPGVALSDGVHTVYLQVEDNYGNLATATWSFTVDATPPTITNLQPPDASITNDNTPTISADYSDLSGINASSVVLEVDGIDIIPLATVTASGVIYIPGTALLDDIHTVYLEVKDIYGNLATASWTFTVDTTPPTITNLLPPDASITNDDTPTISVDYSDLSGINASSVMLIIDGINVTSSATVTASNVSFIPGTVLSDGIHTVYLEVKDIYGNLATKTWSFTVDTTPPITIISPDNYTVKLGTLFTLTATDGVAGSGVSFTQYKIDDGPWIDYVVPFIIDSYEYHNITYRSVDNLGNVENESTLSIYVPEVPITTISIGSPQYGTTPKYVNQFTQFSFSVIDYSGLGYDTYYYIDAVPLILYNEPFTVLSEGAHTIYYYTIDKLGNVEDINTFDIIVDNTPPTATITIGDPNYVLGDTWVTSSSEFTLSTADGGLLPVGIDHTQYRIWNGVWSDWGIFQNEFTLGVNDGIRYVEFYSVDLLGNTESINNRTYIVDNTPPTTTILFEGPSYRDRPEDILNVTSATTFVFSVYNRGLQPVRFDYIEYRIWNNGTWSEWLKYSSGFNLDSGNGTRYIEWYSVDKLQNKEIINNLTVFVDNIPPTTEYILQLESDNSEARISLIPTDIGSGCAFTKYKIDNLTWNLYSNTLVITEPGSHTVYFLSEDNLENKEDQRELTVLIEEPETSKLPIDNEKDTNNKPLIAFLFAIILLVVGTFVSMKRPLKKVKGNKLSTWLLVVLPFVAAESATGVISFFTGILSVPPLFGLGMVVDLGILIAGLIVFIAVYRKSEQMDTKQNQI